MGRIRSALAAEFGTPVFIYDLGAIDRQVLAVRTQFASRRFEIGFSVKANPSLAIVDHMRRLGLGLSVCSTGELEIGRQVGVEGRSITFVGPAKSPADLAAAADYGVTISVESPDELRHLAAIAEGLGTRARVLLRRLVPAFPPLSEARIFGDFLLDKFGMTDDAMQACLSMAPGLPGVEIVGVHAFRGSNIHDVDTLIAHFSETTELALRLFGEAGAPLRVVNLGGGFSVPIEVHDDELDLGLLGRRLTRLETRWDALPQMNGVTVRLEPGRFLVGPSGAYLVRVLAVKAPHGETVAIVWTGRSTISCVRRCSARSTACDCWCARTSGIGPGLAGLGGRSVDLRDRRHRPCRAHATARAGRPDSAMLDVGAYGFTEAMPYFGSRADPAEVTVRDGEVPPGEAPP